MDSLLLESMKEAIVCFLLATIAAVIIVFITLFASVGINKLFLKIVIFLIYSSKISLNILSFEGK